MDEADLKRVVEGALMGLRDEISESRRHAEGLAAETRQHSEAMAAETRRHFDVVAEGLNHKIELVAEGVMTVNERVDRLRDEMKEDFTELRATLTSFHVASAYSSLLEQLLEHRRAHVHRA